MFSRGPIAQRMAMFGWRCWMCGKPTKRVGHVVPLARGGTGCLANLRPACWPACHPAPTKDGDDL